MSRGQKREPRRLALEKVTELLADQMKMEPEYIVDVLTGMIDRLESTAKRKQRDMDRRGDDSDPAVLRAASEFYIFVYLTKVLESIIEDVDIEDVREAKDALELQVEESKKKFMN